jgi:7,8-dihydropterin-6-yl-methyl-4-(beta-D-ribofuranosyl)aminobenzene 5'-phosphate synthase
VATVLIKKSSGISFTILYDNNFYQENIKTGWGFSCLIQGNEKTILFDTGGTDLLLMRNLQKLAIDPKTVDIIILSHNHDDHTGGLDSFLDHNPDVTIYIPISFPAPFIDRVKDYGAEVVKVGKSQALCKNVYSTGELGTWIKEQSLIIKTDRGFVLLTGCAHPGIVPIVEESKKIINDRIILIMGGFHLKDNSQNEIANIIDNLKNLGVQYVGPTHCTGDSARSLFKKEYGDYHIDVGAGKRIFLDNLK